jgi:hypothetical protein
MGGCWDDARVLLQMLKTESSIGRMLSKHMLWPGLCFVPKTAILQVVSVLVPQTHHFYQAREVGVLIVSCLAEEAQVAGLRG